MCANGCWPASNGSPRAESASYGAPTSPDVETLYSFPTTENDPTATDTVAAAFLEHFGPERSMEGPMVTGSEDFGIFGKRGGFPSVFWFVGGTDAELWGNAFAAGRLDDDVPSNHSLRFAPPSPASYRPERSACSTGSSPRVS